MNLLIPCFFVISFITLPNYALSSTIYPSYRLYFGYGFGGDVKIYEIRLLEMDFPNLVALLLFNPLTLLLFLLKLFYFDKDSIFKTKVTFNGLESYIWTAGFLVQFAHQLWNQLLIVLIPIRYVIIASHWSLWWRLLICLHLFFTLSPFWRVSSHGLIHRFCYHQDFRCIRVVILLIGQILLINFSLMNIKIIKRQYHMYSTVSCIIDCTDYLLVFLSFF